MEMKGEQQMIIQWRPNTNNSTQMKQKKNQRYHAVRKTHIKNENKIK